MLSCIAVHEQLLLHQNQCIRGQSFSVSPIQRLSRSEKIPFPILPNLIPLNAKIPNPPKSSSKPPSENSFPFLFPSHALLLPLIVSAIFFSLRLLLPADFPLRWQSLLALSETAVAAAQHFPSHLWQAVVACEDRRFFSHCGMDPIGISRAALFYPAGGGGSTITQQLVKNVFLKHERKFSRKVIEMLLALILERRMSKWKILSSYLCQIYWGHGVYGIESASAFYFGKHPSLLSLGESAMLAGILPSPELRSPLREPSRGKTAQARALRKMVEAGFLDIETALSIVSQPLCLCVSEPERENGPSSATSSGEEEQESKKKTRKTSAIRDAWNWEKATAVWEVREDMEKWAIRMHKRTAVITTGKSN